MLRFIRCLLPLIWIVALFCSCSNMNFDPEAVYSGYTSTMKSGSASHWGADRNTPGRNICSICKGEGRIVKEEVASYGSLKGQSDEKKVRCNECGKKFPASANHHHVICPLCHGNGFFD